jgi:hypothetical protein
MSIKYILGTGWWCTQKDDRNSRFLNGEDFIRSADFHTLWSKAVQRFSAPEKVVVIDSNSPIKAHWDHQQLPYEVICLNKNAGHATNLNNSKYCGWTASVLLSMEYASLCECDFYVYIEQDALIFGKDFVETCIAEMGDKTDYLFGKSENSIQPLQQSFFIIRKTAIDKFCTNLRRIKYDDLVMSPEIKFAVSTSKLFGFIPKFLFIQSSSVIGKIKRRLIVPFLKCVSSFKTTSIGYGRTRPIDFSDSHFYFQHGSQKELDSYLSLLEQESI